MGNGWPVYCAMDQCLVDGKRCLFVHGDCCSAQSPDQLIIAIAVKHGGRKRLIIEVSWWENPPLSMVNRTLPPGWHSRALRHWQGWASLWSSKKHHIISYHEVINCNYNIIHYSSFTIMKSGLTIHLLSIHYKFIIISFFADWPGTAPSFGSSRCCAEGTGRKRMFLEIHEGFHGLGRL